MGRKILLITTDQQRWDALGCTGGTVARTPHVDALAAAGTTYRRAHNQNVVCMPARATIATGQHVRSHGVWMNGVPLPADQPTVIHELHGAGYRTALVGKSHFEPFLSLDERFVENHLAHRGEYGPHRGFDHMELATHAAIGWHHYPLWLEQNHPGASAGFYSNLDDSFHPNSAGGGDTGAVQVCHNPVPRDQYHTDWCADRAIDWLDSLDEDEDWFLWLSFPDPHHPFDPPMSELGRVPWRDLDVPEAWLPPDEARRVLSTKPRHWLDYYEGRSAENFEAPPRFVAADMTADQLREITAMIHIENELIDEAVGKVVGHLGARGWDQDTDVFYTSDHGELQGDFGMLFKGGYHVDALMRLPLIWRPAPSAGAATAQSVEQPVGHLDLAPTFCEIAGLAVPDYMEGAPLPATPTEAEAQGRERVLTEWDCTYRDFDQHLRSIYRDGLLATEYLPGGSYDGTEGELYDLVEDPLQHVNLWDDPARRQLRDDLVADLRASLPQGEPVRHERVTDV